MREIPGECCGGQRPRPVRRGPANGRDVVTPVVLRICLRLARYILHEQDYRFLLVRGENRLDDLETLKFRDSRCSTHTDVDQEHPVTPVSYTHLTLPTIYSV